MLILKRPWTRQPPIAVPAAGSGFSRLTYGPHLGGIDGTLWTPQNSPPVVATPYGLARSFTSGSSQAIRTSISGINSNSVTMFAVARRTSAQETTSEALMSLSTASGNKSTLLYLAIAIGITRVALFIGNGGSYRQAQGPTIDTWSDLTSYIIYVGVVSDSTNGLNCYYSVDGVETASTITTAGTVTAAAPSSLSVGGYFNDGAYVSNFYSNFEVLVAGVLPYAVSEAERKFLMRDLNAWARRLPPQQIIIPTPAAAATAPTITALSARLITASSAQPRISYS